MPYSNKDLRKEYQKRTATPYMKEWREKNREHHRAYMREYARKRRARLNGKEEYAKIKQREQPYKKLLNRSREYYKKNKDRINKRDRREGIDLNSDRYLIRFLQGQGFERTSLREYPQLIETKKLILQIKRETK